MFEFIALSSATADFGVPIAASRAGGLGVVDLQFTDAPERAIEEIAEFSRGAWGVQVEDERVLETVLAAGSSGLHAVVVSVPQRRRLARLVARVRAADVRALAVARCLEDALTAERAGASAVIAKGHEAGGWVGDEGAFVLIQRLLARVRVPVYVQGGIGLHTVAAAYAGGAAGVVLDSQLLLARESPLGEDARAAIAMMDGSETAVVGQSIGAPFRLHQGPARQALEQLDRLETELEGSARAGQRWRGEVRRMVSARLVLPLGQDAAFAADLARRYETVGGIISALREAALDGAITARRHNPLAAESPLARSHGTRYPLAQGPMTRVSDRAEFAAAVAAEGALPFLALALMRAREADTLLEHTRLLLGARPWGVGVLGFVPRELRAEQLAVVRAHRPPFALIAGGRPDQAHELESEGIATYLHVPSPRLLRLYLDGGARRFVFEGRECGGHVGPRTSFVLWDSMLEVILDTLGSEIADCHILLAGGIHDARSAAMAAAALARAAARGVKAGALMGTAYLFTREATQSGAITERFQNAAIQAADTVLLESGPGHATRCLPSPFVVQFEAEKDRLHAAGSGSEETRLALEQLNIGRLRIAAKGVDRHPGYGRDPDAPKLTDVPDEDQWQQGMYMIGQVTALRDELTTVADLHRDVCDGSTERLEALEVPEPTPASAPAPADVAIIGMACILPGAPDARAFWANILGKVDAISEVPAARWDWKQMYDPDPRARDKVYSRWGGFIDPLSFDPIALGLPPNSLSSIEAFQLLALLTAQSALEDAGYATRPFDRERTSVILGAGGGGGDLSIGYGVRSALPGLIGDTHPELERDLYGRLPEWTEDSFAGVLMNVAAGRIANRLDFGGTNYTVDAACASSLTAIAAAAKELQAETSDLVLAGGVDALQNPFTYLCFSKTHALSPRGRCRPFDASADGIAISEGFATVVLKRLADAERDGDRIYAVIRGVGAASDGRDRSLTAPRPEGQMRALRRAYAQAGFSPATVGLLEAHGTGTVAGDSAEVQALTTVFAEHGASRQSCAIGSVKSMIGHTKATAGVAGLVKAALALHHRVLPPTIGVTEPNPKANFPDGPFYPNTEARPWLSGGAEHPRRAGVSAFGFGGTDFHIALEEYLGALAPPSATFDPWPAELLLWRGSRDGIAARLRSLAAQLDGGAQVDLADLAHTLALGADGAVGATLAMVVEPQADLRARLAAALEILGGPARRVHTADGLHFSDEPLACDGAVAFLFPGQGSQVVDMGREVLIGFPEAREPLELADRVLAGCHEQPLSRFIYPPPSFTPEERERRQSELTDTHVAQPALGSVELAYLRVLESCGVQARMAAGHSFGELVALACAGALENAELLRLAELRGRYMRAAAAGQAGAMAAAEAGPAELAPLLDEGRVVVANLNAPRQTVLSGPREHIEAAVRWCAEHGITARTLPVACAFHSPHVADAQQLLARDLAHAALSPPQIPVFSNTTGGAHRAEPRAIAEVLAEHLVRPVQFLREVEDMYEAGARVFVEVGPRAVLTGLVGQILDEREHLAVSVDRPGRSGIVQLLHCLAALVVEGVPVRIERLFRGRRVEPVDLERLAREEEGAAAVRDRWVLDGGGARRLDGLQAPAPSAAGGADVPVQPDVMTGEEQPRVATPTTNGAGSLSPLAAPSTAIEARAPSPPELPVIPAPPPGGERAAEVMHQYHGVMQHFLETERSVMLAYLGAARNAGNGTHVATAASAVVLPPPPREPAAPIAPAAVVPLRAPEPEPAPAAVPEPAPADTAPSAGVTLTAQQIEQRLLSLVSERTGYPTDMLDHDADLEGDLGIDSIKRVEIAGTFAQSLRPEQQVLIDVEELTASRTLREIIGALQVSLAPGTAPVPAAASAEGPHPFEVGPAETERIGRFVVHTESAPTITGRAALHRGGAVLIIDDGGGVGPALARALQSDGHPAILVPRASRPRDSTEADALVESIQSNDGGVSALVHLAIAPEDAEPYGALTTLLFMTQALWEDLERPGTVVLGATALGGTFGTDGALATDLPERAAIHGFLKSLAHELSGARVKSVDLEPGAVELLAEQLRAELEAADGLIEVGYRAGERRRPMLTPEPVEKRPVEDCLTAESVVVVTGGARGITAEVAVALAKRYRCTLVLIGRTAPDPEGERTSALREPADLRRALISAHRDAGEQVSAGTVERELASLLAARQVRETLSRLEATGARSEYLRCDVRDDAALRALIEDVYERHGRVDGVVHGAGIIEDRLVRDKRPDSLERVMATKAGAAQTLAGVLRPESLRFLILFSSVSGRFGNRGQADYAAASEVLNKLAQQLDRRWPTRVTAINWGPWRAPGMVSPQLEREFARRGVALIDIQAGCDLFMEELVRGRKGEVEVVIGGASGFVQPRLPLLIAAERVASATAGRLEWTRDLQLERDRYLDDHRVDGIPVLPFAVAMELMAEAAVQATGAQLAGLRDIRLFKGVAVPNGESTRLSVSATYDEPQRRVALLIGAPDGSRRYYSAVAELNELGRTADTGAPPRPLLDLAPFPMTVEEAYRDVLFHGPLFQGIGAIEGMDERGATAQLHPSAPGPAVAGADGLRWLLDPVLLDSALQLQVIWARTQWDVTLLPAEIASYTRGSSPHDGEIVRHELRIRPTSTPPLCQADHWFLGADGRVLATLSGVVGVGTQALNRLAGAGA